MHHFTSLLFKLIVLTCLSFVSSVSAEEQKDIIDLQTSFDQVKIQSDKLNLENAKIKDLDALQQEHAQLKVRLEECVATHSDQLSNLQKNLELLGNEDQSEEADIQRQRTEFEQQIQDVDTKLKRCNLLFIQLEQLIESTSIFRQSLLKQQFLSREFTLFSAAKRLTKINDDFVHTEFEAIQPLFENVYRISEWPLVLLAFAGVGLGLLWRRHKKSAAIKSTSLSSPTFGAVIRGIKRTSLILLALAFVLFYLYAKESGARVITDTLQYSLLLFFLFGVLRGAFVPDIASKTDNTSLLRGIAFLSWLFLFAAIVTYIFSHEASGRFSQSVILYIVWLSSLTIAALSFITLLWLISNQLLSKHKVSSIYFIPIAAMLASIIAALTGYRNLAILLFFGTLNSIIILTLAFLIIRITSEFFDSLDEGKILWQRKLRTSMGIANNHAFPGVIWLRILLFFSVSFVAVVLLMFVWGSSQQHLSTMVIGLKNGITVGSVSLDLLKLIYGLLILVVVLSVLPFIKNQLLLSWLKHSNLSRGAVEATQTLVGYAGIAIAILWALYVAGVNFKNIAIIAGALSVGIGFGLQNVVNNFVSGIILLFERPIRRGDWIAVGNTEGYVKDISIRSTIIQTFDRADVIVPNSELISNQVTNWQLSSSVGRLKAPVGVAYGVDVSLVMKILEGLANTHPDVISGHPDFPVRVLFLGFGDSALNFELRCFVRNVDNRLNILSEINLGIDREFRKQSIEIPFPQRVIHRAESTTSQKKDIDA